MATTTRAGLRYPLGTDPVNIDQDLKNLAQDADAIFAMFGQGTLASRPTAGKQGRLYYAIDNGLVYWDTGSAWITIVPQIGNDSITAAQIAPDAVGASELANNAVDAAAIQDLAVTTNKIADLAVTAAKIAAALKPSQGAGAGTEALRALGTGSGQALPGNHPTATPVAVIGLIGGMGAGGSYTLAAPVAGTYIIEWGAGGSFGDSQGDSGQIGCSHSSAFSRFADVGSSGGPALQMGAVLTGGQIVTFTVTGSSGFGVLDPWAKLTRTA